jgi:spore germination protein YaaH
MFIKKLVTMLNRVLLSGFIFLFLNAAHGVGNVNYDFPQSDSTTKGAAPAVPPAENGFIKKLFTGASKAEKVAKKEAKSIKDLQDLQTEIYGWYPYWNRMPYADINFNLLTTFSYFSIDGTLDPATNRIVFDDHGINGPSTKEMLQSVTAAGCRIDVTFKFNDKNSINLLLNNVVVRDSCLASIIKIMNANYLYDGICIEFENMPPNISAALVQFMSALKAQLKPSGRTVALTLPAMDYSNNYNILNLNKVVDTYILLCYNYHSKGSEPGPVSPLVDTKRKNSVKTSVNEYLNAGVPYNKLIVALPFYGIVWKEDANKPDHYSFYKHWTYGQVKNNLAVTKPQIQYDSVAYTCYYDFEMNGENFRCFFDNDKTLAGKYKWLIKQGIAGVGIWALGYDKGSSDLWEMIDKNFKVKKLNPLIKEITISQRVLQDSTASAGDSVTKFTSIISDTLIRDTIFSKIFNPDVDTIPAEAAKSILMQQLEKLREIFRPLLSNEKVALTVMLTLINFGLLGIIASLLFSSVRKLLYITTIPVYILTNLALILAGLGLFAFLGLFKADINSLLPGYYNKINLGIWVTLICFWLIINLLSYKLIGSLSLKGEKP